MHCHTVLRVMLKIMCSLSADRKPETEAKQRKKCDTSCHCKILSTCVLHQRADKLYEHDHMMLPFIPVIFQQHYEWKRNAWWEEPHPAVLYNIQSFIFYLVTGSRSLNSVKASWFILTSKYVTKLAFLLLTQIKSDYITGWIATMRTCTGARSHVEDDFVLFIWSCELIQCIR